jgi:transcription elongation factor Elf1
MSALKEALPKNDKCPYCGSEHKLPVYVFAHWNDMFSVICEDCGKSYKLLKGKTWRTRQREKQ